MAHPIKHFITITKHRNKVIAHCAKAGILRRGLLHDLSKYMPAEFIGGARFFTGQRSPNDLQRKKYGYSQAWMHHKGRNKHHFEYWTDYNPESHRMEPVKMPLIYVIEMFCDRIAASKIYQGDQYNQHKPLKYFLRGKEFMIIHPDTLALLEQLTMMLSECGEEETFKFIKQELRKQKDY